MSAAEQAQILEMLANFGEAEGVDVSDDALEFCKAKGLKAHKGLAEKLPFADESFDVATALDVVEHLGRRRCRTQRNAPRFEKRRQNFDFRSGVYVAVGRSGRYFKSSNSLHKKTNCRKIAKSRF